MAAACPCHVVFARSIDFYEHLVEEHGADAGQAFVLAQLGLFDVPVAYEIVGGDVIVRGYQSSLICPPEAA